MDIPNSTTTKRCTKCGIEYPATTEHFRRSKSGKYGITARCKSCLNKEGNARYRANRENVGKQQHDYYMRHAEERKAYARAYYQDNREKTKGQVKKWRNNNPDKVRSARHKWASNNPDKVAERVKRWRAANPEKRRVQAHRRRALERSVGGSFTSIDIDAIRVAQDNRCYICHKKLTKYHIDHFIPITLGGSNDPGNLRLACPRCNQSKNGKHPHDLGLLI